MWKREEASDHFLGMIQKKSRLNFSRLLFFSRLKISRKIHKKMPISIITAMTQEGVIGLDQKLPWHIREELQYFKSMTLNKPIVMGLRTFESIGSRPLPRRRNVILTRNKNFVCSFSDCTILHSIESVLNLLKNENEIMIIGGASVYKQFLPLASRLYITIIHEVCKGDTYFPTINWSDWTLKEEHSRLLFTTKVYDRN